MKIMLYFSSSDEMDEVRWCIDCDESYVMNDGDMLCDGMLWWFMMICMW